MSDSDYDFEIKSAHIIPHFLLTTKWRVKLYHLNLQGQWDDMGTGHVSIKREVNFFYKF